MPVFELIELPFCKILRVGPWNDSPHSYFIAHNSRDDFRHVLGLPVTEEFCTFSSPIFLAPIPILGKIYNAGISLAHKRNSDMDIDTGWPPLCVGYDAPAPELPADWETLVLAEMQRSEGTAPKGNGFAEVEGYQMQWVVIGQAEVAATDAPLLPGQLRRIAQTSRAPFCLAFATGNRITRARNGAPFTVHAVSEEVLSSLRNRERIP